MGDLLTAGLSIFGIGASAAGAAQQADAARLSGQASANNYYYQAGIADLNAKLATRNATWARITGDQQASVAGAQGRAQIGAIRTGLGANGVDVNSGSARQVTMSAGKVSSDNQTTIRSNAAQQAYNYDVQSIFDTKQAKQDRVAAGYAEQGASISADASIIGGAASVASKWAQASQSGTFSGVSKAFSGLGF